MQFLETSVFTRQVTSLLTDDEYGQLQMTLSAHPDAGAIIPHGGGLRKIRWGAGGRGKRGGVRVILLGRHAGSNPDVIHVSQKWEGRSHAHSA
jgi:hypothetical protein